MSDRVTIQIEAIETNLWMAEAYLLRGALSLARECLNAATLEYVALEGVSKIELDNLAAKLTKLQAECGGQIIRMVVR